MTLNLSASPHVRDRWTTSFIMHTVLLSLMPAAIVGCFVYGWNALFVILASILAAVGTEALFCLACKKPLSITDGSAAVTGSSSAYVQLKIAPWGNLSLASALKGVPERCNVNFRLM